MTPALEVEGLVKHFRSGGDEVVHAVDGVSFSIAAGTTLALVGESGCGKTTTTRLVTRLLEPDRGRVLLGSTEITALRERELRALRSRLQIVFQDPSSSLDPRWTVARIVEEPLRIRRLSRTAVPRLLEQVGLDASVGVRHPGELSSGQRQRAALARALALDPEVLVLDEPVSALDVSVRGQILNLLHELQRARDLTYLFVTHDLAIVQHIANEIAVMYLGRIVERGPTNEVCARPRHPYTRALVDAVPVPDPAAAPYRPAATLGDELASSVELPSGCRFRTRCPKAQARCAEEDPLLTESDGRAVACHFPD